MHRIPQENDPFQIDFSSLNHSLGSLARLDPPLPYQHLSFLPRVPRSPLTVRFSQLSALRRILSTGNICRIRTLSGVHRTLEESSRDLSLFKFKYGAVVLFVVLGLLNSLFKGKAVAKLLFKPFGFVMKSDEDEPQRAARGGSDRLFDALSLINWRHYRASISHF